MSASATHVGSLIWSARNKVLVLLIQILEQSAKIANQGPLACVNDCINQSFGFSGVCVHVCQLQG